MSENNGNGKPPAQMLESMALLWHDGEPREKPTIDRKTFRYIEKVTQDAREQTDYHNLYEIHKVRIRMRQSGSSAVLYDIIDRNKLQWQQ